MDWRGLDLLGAGVGWDGMGWGEGGLSRLLAHPSTKDPIRWGTLTLLNVLKTSSRAAGQKPALNPVLRGGDGGAYDRSVGALRDLL